MDSKIASRTNSLADKCSASPLRAHLSTHQKFCLRMSLPEISTRLTGNAILELLLRLTREQRTATLVATHSAEAAGIADVVITLRDGRIADVKRK